jgi:hypothetical protein
MRGNGGNFIKKAQRLYISSFEVGSFPYKISAPKDILDSKRW